MGMSPGHKAGRPGHRSNGPVHGLAEPDPWPAKPASGPAGPTTRLAVAHVVVFLLLLLPLLVRCRVYEFFYSRRETLVIQKSAFSGVFSSFGSKADGNLFCLFWVTCMVRFSCF
jgi:hypothetical protein